MTAKAVKIMQEANWYQARRLLGWDELTYGQFQMDSGLAYLARIMGTDTYGISQMSRSALFWRWWRNHWDRIDELFIRTSRELEQEARQELYLALHNPQDFNYYPHRTVLHDCHRQTLKEKAPC